MYVESEYFVVFQLVVSGQGICLFRLALAIVPEGVRVTVKFCDALEESQ
jgi:hypothetical protein